jgi:diketogulonate reductase-like aldo/keto reductase
MVSGYFFATLATEGLFSVALHPYSGIGSLSATVARALRFPTLARIGEAHGCSAAAVALAWGIRSGNVFAIPESGSGAANSFADKRAILCNERCVLAVL